MRRHRSAKAGLAAGALLFGFSAHSEEFPKPPALLDPPPLEGRAAAEEMSAFRLGVRAYIERRDAEALAHLKRAVVEKPEDEAAKKLLLKVFFRVIHDHFDRKRYDDAWKVLAEAKAFFPGDPSIRELEPPARPAPPSEVRTEPAPRPRTRPPAPPRSASPRKPPVPAAAVAPAEAPRAAVPREAPRPRPWASALILALAASLAAVMAAQRRGGRRLRALGEELRHLRAEMAAAAARAEEMRRLEREADASERERLRAELEGRERETRRLLEAYQEERRLNAREAAPAKPARRENEILVEITPPEREADARRIAVEVLAVFSVAPGEAVEFLRTLAGDATGPTRLLLVPALAKVRVPPALEMLLEMHADPRPMVRREVLKQLKALLAAPPAPPLPADFRMRASALLQEEQAKAEWVM